MDQALPPHPELTRYWRGTVSAKRGFLRDIFDSTAVDYDRVEGIVALGSGRWYRRQALLRAGLHTGDHVLDVAIGTGLVAREAIAIVGPRGSVMGLDPSLGMVSQARRSLDLPIVLGRGEQIPLADESFDFLSMGYALRHLSDLRAAFDEYFRVLRPGGRVCLLEIIRPENRLLRKATEAYFPGVLPILSRLSSSDKKTAGLWVYYWETIDQCVPGAVVLDALRSAGFVDVKRHVELGLFAEYTAARP